MPDRGKGESRAFANYLSIDDRYSAQTNFDSRNTIGERLRVNRAHKRSAAFLPTVIKRQQWQIGDSLLNCKFGQPAQPRKEAPNRLSFRLSFSYPLSGLAARAGPSIAHGLSDRAETVR
jgi:hypothetical protein